MKKVLILEDNTAAREQLERIVQEIDIKCEVYSFDNVKDAYHCACEKIIDLFLVDIILDTSKPGDVSGLQFVESIRQMNHYFKTSVIITTSLEDPRLFTYRYLHCYAFIEKPFDVKEVKSLILECLEYNGGIQVGKRIPYRVDGISVILEREKIIYAECRRRNLYIHMEDGEVLSIPYITLKRFIEDADSPKFVQCRKDTVFNIDYLQSVDRTNRYIQFKGIPDKIEIGLGYLKNVMESIK